MKYVFVASGSNSEETILERMSLRKEDVEISAFDREGEKEPYIEIEEGIVINDSENKYLRNILEKICDAMKTTYDLDISEDEENIKINLAGEELGYLIGKRGRTLEATEMLLSIMVNRSSLIRKRIALDINSYRDKRREYLKDMAMRLATRAIERDEETILEPMSPRDRRIVHMALQDFPGVETTSIGEDPERKIVIKPVSEE
ncbi:MAG: KH domain-containing protein [Actinomycetia bacterium]|nr:KH domain-containing protein [Actinomycetes bacterium]